MVEAPLHLFEGSSFPQELTLGVAFPLSRISATRGAEVRTHAHAWPEAWCFFQVLLSDCGFRACALVITAERGPETVEASAGLTCLR